MQYATDLLALQLHEADVRHAERELAIRLAVAERAENVDGAARSALRDRRRAHRTPRLAWR